MISIKKGAALIVTSALLLVGAAEASATSEPYYKDVGPNHWAKDSIEYLTDMGAIKGYPDGKYHQAAPVSRAQAAKIITIGAGIQRVQDGQRFTDIPTDSWPYPYVESLYHTGAISGYPDGTFRHSNTLTRAQMAKILVEAFELRPGRSESFSDVKSTHWAHNYIAILSANGVTTGKGDGTYDPQGKVNRSQLAAMVDRAMESTGKKVDVTPGEKIADRDIEKYRSELLSLHNQEREKKGLAPLKIDQTLNTAAQEKAVDFHSYSYMSHLSPRYGSIDNHLRLHDADFWSIGENIAYWLTDSKDVVQGWIDSPGHYRNIVNDCYDKVGFGIYGVPDSELLYYSVYFTGSSPACGR